MFLISFCIEGYVRFSNERREELKKTCPEMSVLEVTKKMAEEWNTMAVEKKKPFLDAADIDKRRYQEEMKEYLAKKVADHIHNCTIRSRLQIECCFLFILSRKRKALHRLPSL